MKNRAFVLVFTLLALAVLTPLPGFAASTPANPAISLIRGRIVYVKVPPGFASVALQQRTGLKQVSWITLGSKTPSAAGGTLAFSLKSAVALRALRVTGVRTKSTTNSSGVGTKLFRADPALKSSGGFTSAGGVTSGVVSVSSATTASLVNSNSVTLGNNVSSTPDREVAESDIWRVDGNRLYYFNELRGLQVFDVSNPDDPVALGHLREPNHGDQMYLLDSNHVVLLVRPSSFFNLSPSVASLDSGSGSAVIVDVTSGKPKQVGAIAYPGYLVESRLVGTALYLVSQVWGTSQDGLIVTSYDLSDPANPAQAATLSLGSYGGVVTATDQFLFVVRYTDSWTRSIVDVIDISNPNGAMKRRGSVKTAGWIESKFAMNLTGTTFTTVSAVPEDWSLDPSDPASQPQTVVENFSLTNPSAPTKLGSLTLGSGETVRATRFADGRLYVVTYFSIDPLWVVDLSNFAQPVLLGELQLPGFSNYIEPLGDRLVAVGMVGSKTEVSLFDVANPAAPQLLSQIPLGDGYSYSEANWDEKALTVLPDQNLILVPYSGYDSTSGWANSVQLLDLTHDAITARGVVKQPIAVRRTAVVNNRILGISSSDLITVNFTDRDHPTVTSDVEIAWSVSSVFVSGNYLIQIGGSASNLNTVPPVITISSTTDPDTSLATVNLANVQVIGAAVHNGKLYVAQQPPSYSYWYPIVLLNTITSATTPTTGNPLTLSVYDLSKLPTLTLLGQTQVTTDAGTGYGLFQLEATWPTDQTLVWVRPQWTSWWYDYPVAYATNASSGALLLSGTTATINSSTLPTLGSVLSGTSSGTSLVKTGSGTLTLSTGNGLNVATSSGTLAVGSVVGSASGLVLSTASNTFGGGTLTIGNTGTSAGVTAINGLTINPGTVHLNTGLNGALTISGTINPGSLTLTTVGTTITSGTTPIPSSAASKAGRISRKSGKVSGGTLILGSSSYSGVVSSAGTSMVAPTTFAGSAVYIVGSGGSLTLTGLSTYTGSTSISSGPLTLNTGVLWLAPWYRPSYGHEMLVFDVSKPAAPSFTKALDVRNGSTGDWSAAISLGSKLYLSYIAYDDPTPLTGDAISRQYREFMKTVDFSTPASPVVSAEVNIPGKLLGVSNGGAALLTVGCGYDANGQPTGSRVFHASSYDGTAATLTDQLSTPNAYDPYAVAGPTLFVGTQILGTGQAGQIQSWQIGSDGKFTSLDLITATPFWGLSTLHGLLIGNGNGLPHLFDVSDPTNLQDLGNLDTTELTSTFFDTSDGGAGLGIWQPLGDYGVGFVLLGQ